LIKGGNTCGLGKCPLACLIGRRSGVRRVGERGGRRIMAERRTGCWFLWFCEGAMGAGVQGKEGSLFVSSCSIAELWEEAGFLGEVSRH